MKTLYCILREFTGAGWNIDIPVYSKNWKMLVTVGEEYFNEILNQPTKASFMIFIEYFQICENGKYESPKKRQQRH